ncbi:hypothetical protein SNEBB_001011 [Seison nebaliae]|nr:hypothetical protein SNEBB_001011 [Seison nebaliae]
MERISEIDEHDVISVMELKLQQEHQRKREIGQGNIILLTQVAQKRVDEILDRLDDTVYRVSNAKGDLGHLTNKASALATNAVIVKMGAKEIEEKTKWESLGVARWLGLVILIIILSVITMSLLQ